MEETDKTEDKQNTRPWLYKKGQSGNPAGRPKGVKTMKTYIKEKLTKMTDAEREVFLEGIDKKIIWEMAEDKAKQGTDITSGGEKIQFATVNYADTDTIPVQAEEIPVTPAESTG